MSLFSKRPRGFVDSFQETIHHLSSSQSLDGTVDFRSGVAPDQVDRASLGKLLALVIFPVIENSSGSLSLTINGQTATWSRTMGEATEALSPLPWRLAQALVDELTEVVDPAGVPSSGALRLTLNRQDLSLQIAKTASPKGPTVTVTHSNWKLESEHQNAELSPAAVATDEA